MAEPRSCDLKRSLEYEKRYSPARMPLMTGIDHLDRGVTYVVPIAINMAKGAEGKVVSWGKIHCEVE